MTTKLFSELGIAPELLKAIDKLGFEQASPIQAEAIPVLLAGRDVVGQSQTGSGKTAAFAVPAIQGTDPMLKAVQALILCPTRELAMQVAEEIHKLSLFKRGIHALPIYGGQSYERQFDGLRAGAQIVIGTPGRVMDHMRRGTLRLDKVKMVILDEADVMLDMGFQEDIEFILKAVPAERQTVFFSATMPRPIQRLIQNYSRDPQSVSIEQKEMTVPTVEQSYYEVDRWFKMQLLTRLIDLHDLKLGIVFCNTKRMVDDLVDHLNAQGYSADRLHGDMTQAMRDRVMNKFRRAGIQFLVATDVAARGIDVENIEVVFNYDLPYDSEDYVHRIGRTGRAGREGRAISFASGREVFQIRQIEKFTRVKMQRGKPPTAGEVESARNNVFLDKLRLTLKGGEFKAQSPLIERLLEEGFNSTDIAAALLHQLQAAAAPAPSKQRDESFERPPFREERRGRFDREPRRDFDRDRPPRAPRRPWGERDAQFGEGDRPAPRRAERGTMRGVRVSPAAEAPATPAAPSPAPAAAAVVPASPAEATVPQPAPSAPATAPAPAKTPSQSQEPAAIKPPKSAEAPAKPALEKRKPHEASRPEPFRPGADRPQPKHSRRTPSEQTRLYMNVGEAMGVLPRDVVGAILGETGLPANVVGVVDIRDRHLFVDVASEHANSIISKLNRTSIKTHRLKVKVA
jgi:ATP-dependent RNA helicase DeaD